MCLIVMKMCHFLHAKSRNTSEISLEHVLCRFPSKDFKKTKHTTTRATNKVKYSPLQNLPISSLTTDR